jgi:hypothetical protein
VDAVDSFESSLVVAMASGIPRVLLARDDSKVLATVIKPLVIDMVHNESVGRVHDDAGEVAATALAASSSVGATVNLVGGAVLDRVASVRA